MAVRSFRAVVGKDDPNPFDVLQIDRAYRLGCREHLRRGPEG